MSPSPEIPRADRDGFDPVPELIPARMLNEFAYCPRLAYLELDDSGRRLGFD